MSNTEMPRRCERTAFRVISGEGLLMVIDRRELHRLNAVGTRVFELCDGATTIEGIVDAIVDEFEIDAATARGDVDRFVAELRAAGAISVQESA